ncbi:dipeptidyl peptidase 9-like [Watersipora subatra]|uniref:dipeptidyl peptidase 9-like n=1 Tax=Watersipora subatra TaxID=2589382 RepID=UPI00355B9DA1
MASMRWCETDDSQALPKDRKSWSELHEHVKNAGKLQAKLCNMVPDMFTFREVHGKARVYFLGVPPMRRDNTLMYCDVTKDGRGCHWKQLIDSAEASDAANLSKNEQLLMERKRLSLKGLTSYSIHLGSGRIVFSSSSKLHTCIDSDFTSDPLPVTTLPTQSDGSKLDPKICPNNPNLISYVANSDLWLFDLASQQEHRLTYSRQVSPTGVQTVSSGHPSYIMQEEFSRYTGYWWQPITSSLDGKYRIIYEEIDETNVDIINIISQTSDSSGVEPYRYPRAGATNALSRLRVVEFFFSDDRKRVSVSILDLKCSLTTLYPLCEYLVRLDWCPDGQRVGVQLLDRAQQRLALVLIPLTYFVPALSSIDEALLASEMPVVLHEEYSDIWINVNDCLTFIPSESKRTVRYIWASERTGYRHLYHFTVDLQKPTQAKIKPLTHGEWPIDCFQQVSVDLSKNLVYFTAYKDTPLETHLYSVSLISGNVQRLTTLGYNHKIAISESQSLVVSTFSSVDCNPRCNLYEMLHDDGGVAHLKVANVILAESELDSDYQPPIILQCPFKQGTDIMHCMLFKPHNFKEGCKYPTILYVYAGPLCKMVVNVNRAHRLIRLHTLASLGYVVVCVDGRGSMDRGHQWEGHLKGRMGTVEIADQVEGLQYLALSLGYIDMERVAIHGWSYGGYISLMGLIQRPEIFKVSISGAPVTKWELYDTGYTERYMSTPSLNQRGYDAGSVLNYVDKFPDEENRLLIIHGMIDENVHLVHTTALINELSKACKPYQVQVYPNERHGIRNPECGQHFQTMVLSFLQNNL